MENRRKEIEQEWDIINKMPKPANIIFFDLDNPTPLPQEIEYIILPRKVAKVSVIIYGIKIITTDEEMFSKHMDSKLFFINPALNTQVVPLKIQNTFHFNKKLQMITKIEIKLFPGAYCKCLVLPETKLSIVLYVTENKYGL